MDETAYLCSLKEERLNLNNWQSISLTRAWTHTVPSRAGVYVLRENDAIIYVGKSGNLRKRMQDLLDSRHHTVRRTIGQKLFSSHDGFTCATTKKKFPDHIETLLNNHIGSNLSIAYIQVPLGRKELEELVLDSVHQGVRLNKRGKRKAE